MINPNENAVDRNGFDIPAIWLSLKVRWLTVVITTAIFFLASYGYTTIMVPVYRAEVLLLPASQVEMKELVLAHIAIGRSDTPEIYDRLRFNDIFFTFKQNLASRTHQYEFLHNWLAEEGKEAANLPEFVSTFSDGYRQKMRDGEFVALSLTWSMSPTARLNPLYHLLRSPDVVTIAVNSDKTTFSRRELMLSVEATNPITAAELANDFVELAIEKTNLQVIDLVKAGMEIRKFNVAQFIKHQLTVAQQEREDHIRNLENAISIARNLDFREPTTVFGGYTFVQITPPPSFYQVPTGDLKSYNPHSLAPVLPLYSPVAITHEPASTFEKYTPPLYSRGWLALQNELAIIRSQEIELFIPNIRQLLAQQAWMESFNITKDDIRAVNITQSANIPVSPISLGPLMVLILGTLFGIIFGSFLALCAHVLNPKKQVA